MGDRTKIQWTDASWNPVVGCDKVSPGCENCYAETIAERFRGGPGYPNGFDVTLKPHKLDEPLKWTTPRRVFVNSMSDLFHPKIPDEYIAETFGVMAVAGELRHHTFQVLTKRHARMRVLLGSDEFRTAIAHYAYRWAQNRVDAGYLAKRIRRHGLWPLPNVWLGHSVEDQERADQRIPALVDTTAAVRFLSCEPLLAAVDLDGWLFAFCRREDGACPRLERGESCPECLPARQSLQWVIVGGESGPGARPMDLQWARSLVKQCEQAGIAVFVKQLGSVWARENGAADSKGGDIDEWPEDLRVRQMPEAVRS